MSAGRSMQGALDDAALLQRAVDLARNCTPCDTAFSVGAVIVSPEGVEISRGFSRETEARAHAEEVAIAKALAAGKSLTGATLYSSMEPCSQRVSGRQSCCQRIIDCGISRVVYCLDEPPIFVVGQGVKLLRDAGIEVVRIESARDAVRAVNRHILASENWSQG